MVDVPGGVGVGNQYSRKISSAAMEEKKFTFYFPWIFFSQTFDDESLPGPQNRSKRSFLVFVLNCKIVTCFFLISIFMTMIIIFFSANLADTFKKKKKTLNFTPHR